MPKINLIWPCIGFLIFGSCKFRKRSQENDFEVIQAESKVHTHENRYQLEINLDCCIQPGHICWVALKAHKKQQLLFAVNFQNDYFCLTYVPR